MIDYESPLVGFLHFRHLFSGVHRCSQLDLWFSQGLISMFFLAPKHCRGGDFPTWKRCITDYTFKRSV